MEKQLAYRPSIGALIVNKNKQFLLTELVGAKDGELDFVKGGREAGETEEQTLHREIAEELGKDFRYRVLEKSNWNIVYEWPPDLQKEKGFLGQARVSFWVLYESGEIKLNTNELRSYCWITENNLDKALVKIPRDSFYVETLLLEWEKIKKQNKHLWA